MRCEDCKFWEADNDNDKNQGGSCHRYPPIYPPDIAEMADDGWPVFPFTNCWDWCGEFISKRVQIQMLPYKMFMEMGMSIRAAKCLTRAGIVTKDMFFALTHDQIESLRFSQKNCGDITVRELLVNHGGQNI